MCATKNKKCLFLSLRFVSSSSRLRLFRPFGCACFPFLLYSKFRFAFFSPKGLRVFIVFRTTDWLQYEKTKKPEHKFRWALCVCAPNLVLFFLVAAAFMIIEPSHTLTHTHTLSPSVQHLSLSQNSRCISESHLKFGFFSFYAFFFFCFFSFLREPIMRFVFRISNIFHSSLWFRLGGTICVRQRAAGRGWGKTNLLFFHCN